MRSFVLDHQHWKGFKKFARIVVWFAGRRSPAAGGTGLVYKSSYPGPIAMSLFRNLTTFTKSTFSKMKSLALAFFFLLSVAAYSQSDDQVMTYTTTGAELIFSMANIDQGGSSGDASLRFAPVINLQ